MLVTTPKWFQQKVSRMWRTAVVVHRGLHHTLPENSIAAFEAALAAGFQWCELDVHASADGEPVVIHDFELDRTTDASGTVVSRSWSELRGLRLRNGAGHETDHPLPHLRDALSVKNACWMLEIKPKDNRELVHRVIDIGREHKPFILMSFDANNLRHAAEYWPSTWTVLLAESEQDLSRAADGTWGDVFVDYQAPTALFEAIGRQQRDIGFWTVNTAEDVPRLLKWKPKVIISDEPEICRDALASAQG
jgi:glycerophosphoryl diester phosphodiesterase